MTEAAAPQSWDPERYARNAGFVAALGVPVLELLDPQPGERILDLGCGDGVLTEKLVAAGAEVTGVDSSAEQIEAARACGLDAHVGDGEALDFPSEFDAVFSNAALHWMRDHDAVLSGVRRALKPGGRFVAEMGGYTNVAALVVALTAAADRRGLDGRAANPWYFPSPEEYAGRLQAHGFVVDDIFLVPRLTPLPGHVHGWLETFAESWFARVPEADRDAYRDEVVRLVEPVLRDANGKWSADYVRLRFKARLA